MSDEIRKDNSPKTKPTDVENSEDAETRATRRELKQSSISDSAKDSTSVNGSDKADDASTPKADSPDAATLEKQEQNILSPKKKRSHDQLGQDQDSVENDATSTTSTDSAKDRASRLEPEKKRHRDAEADDAPSEPPAKSEPQSSSSPANKDQQTSASAFAASGFGQLSSASSPFASLGDTKASGFGAATGPRLSSFASPPPAPATQSAEAPKLTFGGGAAASISPFGGLASKTSSGFGSTFGGGGSAFGSTASGIKPLGSFAAPGGQPLSKAKAAKPFGAPDSDVEDGAANEEGENDSQPDEERAASPEKESEEKKKLRLQKIAVNDGESGETTIVSVRAKVFHHDKEVGWKERGAGMLKINVPEACVEFDDAGLPIPGSFDASGLEMGGEDEEDQTAKSHKVARLILRQDQTHRVILNTAILPTMKFQDKASLKSVGILFTAFEGEDAKAVNITVKMTAANAKIFMNEVGVIQRELQSN